MLANWQYVQITSNMWVNTNTDLKTDIHEWIKLSAPSNIYIKQCSI